MKSREELVAGLSTAIDGIAETVLLTTGVG